MQDLRAPQHDEILQEAYCGLGSSAAARLSHMLFMLLSVVQTLIDDLSWPSVSSPQLQRDQGWGPIDASGGDMRGEEGLRVPMARKPPVPEAGIDHDYSSIPLSHNEMKLRGAIKNRNDGKICPANDQQWLIFDDMPSFIMSQSHTTQHQGDWAIAFPVHKHLAYW